MSNIDRAQKYRDCAARGLSQAQTARELGVTRRAVQKIADRHGILFRSSAEARHLMIAALADDGALTRREIADAVGLSLSHVYSLTSRDKRIRRQPLPAPLAAQIAALAAGGMTASEVARHLGIPASTVSWAKKRFGIVFLRDGRSNRSAAE